MDLLRTAAQHIAGGRRQQAAALLSRNFGDQAEDDSSVQERLFALGLMKQLHGNGSVDENLYRRDFGVPQIDLFEELARALPLMTIARKVANACLERAIDRANSAVIFDIGIGKGQQIIELMDRLARRTQPLHRLTLVGIDLAEDCLEATLRGIDEFASAHGLPLQTIAIASPIEDIDLEVLQSAARGADTVVVNSAFSLHHVPTSRQKDNVLGMLSALAPDVFVLTEPDSDHETDDLESRFENAWQHFGRVFRMIDRGCTSATMRLALKATFFAREIEDILGATDSARRERHESAAMWSTRLTRAGFLSMSIPPLDSVVAPVSVQITPDHVSLGFEGEPLVAQFCLGLAGDR